MKLRATHLTLVLLAALGGCATQPPALDHFTVLRRVDHFAPPAPAPAVFAPVVHLTEPPRPAPPPVMVTEILRVRGTLGFSFGGVRTDDLDAVDALASRIKALPGLQRVTVTGYADSIGTDRENSLISFRRALFVKALLIARGVPADKIEVSAAGATDFVVDPAACRGGLHARVVCQAPNRRVEVLAVGSVNRLVPGR